MACSYTKRKLFEGVMGMKRFLTTVAVLVALTVPAAADKSDTQAACVLGWAALAIENGAKTVDAARNAGWRHCRHLKEPMPKNINKEDWKEVEGDRSEYLNFVIYRMFETLTK
jgi:hypothetical protein